MAVLVNPHLPSLLFIPNHLRQTIVRCSSFSEVKMPTLKGTASSSGGKSKGAAILWYKNDLRVDDHRGLIAASRHSVVVPLYVLDHRIIGHFTEEMLELLLFAVEDLRKSLKGLGSDLVVRFGRTESVIQDLVKEVRASSIYTEKEVEYNLQLLMEIVEANLATILLEEKSPKLLLWGTDFYDMKNMKDLPASYEDFERLKLAVQPPVLPTKLPALEVELAWGCIPKLGDLKELINNNPCKSKDSWISTKNTSAEYVLQKARISKSKSMTDGFVLESGESNQSQLNAQGKSKIFKKSFFITQGKFVGGGTSDVLNALAAYLRYFEGTSRDDWQEIHEKLRYAETREGASFGALFGPALQLGIISRRRVYHETIKYEKERNGGFLLPFGYSTTTVAAAVGHVHSMEWYWLMALRSQMDYTERYPARYWRWNGHLIQYTAVGHAGPAILLVHGFGAFLDHYRDNMHDIAQGGNRVWAITLLGFGRSEKPNVVYTELMWAELLRNFIVDVVGEPVHLVGNSFGGYFVSIVAGLWPALVGSVVLLNSAGHYIPGYSSVPPSKERQTSGIAWLGARLLSFYLRLSFRNLVKRCYPTKTNRADEGLLNEMMRASYDPGVVVVLESIFTFDPSIPLNYLLKGFEEKVLIIQGMKDPISDSKKKVAVVRQHFKGILIKELDAGHCPHDELPTEVNSIIQEWVVDVESTSVKGVKEKSELPA